MIMLVHYPLYTGRFLVDVDVALVDRM